MALTKELVLASNYVAKRPISNNSFLSIGGVIPPDRTTDGYLRAYEQVGWWHAVVFRIALGCSEVKWVLNDVSNRNKPVRIFKHPVLDLLHQINPFQTSNEFIALDTIYEESLGECFWALNFNALNEPAEIILPYPNKMSVVPAREFPFVKGYVYGYGADAIPFTTNEIIHIKFPNPLNQYRGLGQAQSIGINLDAEIYAGEWNRNFFYNSARPDGVIEFDYNLSDEQFEKLKKQWTEKYKGVSKAHQVALLEGGGKYKQIQNTVKDMDFSNLSLRNRDIILGVEGMPLSVMSIKRMPRRAIIPLPDGLSSLDLIGRRLNYKSN
jgi:HK97 family phage portal protein